MAKSKQSKKQLKRNRRYWRDTRPKFLSEFKINQTEEQRQQAIKALTDDLTELPEKIQSRVNRIRKKITGLEIESLLVLCFGNQLVATLGQMAEVEASYEDNIKERVKEYVFNVLASSTPQATQVRCEDGDYRELLNEIKLLHEELFHFVLCKTAVDSSQLREDTMDRADAFMRWLWIRGKRYREHEEIYLRGLLEIQNDLLLRTFGLTVNDVIHGVQKMSYALTYGILDAGQDIKKLQKDFFEFLDNRIDIQSLVPEEQMREYQKETDTEEKVQAMFENFSGIPLINATQTGWNQEFLSALSWGRGENKEFFENPYPGWPIKALPSLQRPFLSQDGKFYCFDLYIFLDNLYRCIERAVLIKEPNSRQLWSDGQKEASEQFVSDIFQSLLPDSDSFRNLLYKAPSPKTGKREWFEIDEVRVCGDHLLLIETKGGSSKNFTPFTEYEGHVDVLRGLIYKPFEQAKRILDEIRTNGSIDLFTIVDGRHEKILELNSSSFRHITLVGVSVDNITDQAAKREDLTRFGIDPDKYPLWVVSIDDLLIFRDMFLNPLIFLHFLEERIRASRSKVLDTSDEIDHAAAYFTHINYVAKAESVGPNAILSWFGYQQIFDKYYALIERYPEEAEKPIPSVPTFLSKVIEKLWNQSRYDATKVVSIILDLYLDDRTHPQGWFDEAIKLQHEKNRIMPLHIGNENGVTILAGPTILLSSYSKDEIHRFVHGVMRARNLSSRLLIKVTIDNDTSEFNSIETEWIELDIQSQNPVVDIAALEYKRRQMNKRLETGKVGRNDPCPCGSGKKFKKCCINLIM